MHETVELCPLAHTISLLCSICDSAACDMLISLIIHGLVLERRGYNDKVIESGLSKASEINRNNLLEYKGKKINKRVLTYHPSLEKISGIVRHHWKENETRSSQEPV